MTDILNRDLSYFRNLRNNKRLIESFDIDLQFAAVADYLNNEIIPDINALAAGALPGINGSPDYFLTNVGDGSVIFDTLDNVIVDSTIPSTKLELALESGRVLVSNNLGELDLTPVPTNANMVLTYRNGDVPEYRFISTVNIEDGAVTAPDIADGSIIREHLHQEIIDIIDAAVPNEVVNENPVLIGSQFDDLSITADKFIANTIATERKLGIINNTLPTLPPDYNRIIRRNQIKNGTITPDKVKPDTIGALHFDALRCITKNKLASDLIDDSFFRIKLGQVYNKFDIKNNQRFSFSSRMLSPNFRLQRQHLTVNTNKYACRAWDFEDSVRLAFRRFGCY